LDQFDYRHAVVAAIHALAGAIWLGAMVYSLFLLHPRAQRYFAKARDFEDFIAFVSHGARWKVLGGLAVIAATGGVLTVLSWPQGDSSQWFWFLGVKSSLFLAALGLFVLTSWRLWPARVLALEDEFPRFQTTFRRVAITMIGIATVSMTLGIWMHMGR
jgi:hypothetical protein